MRVERVLTVQEVLAASFDKAATICPTDVAAARYIESQLMGSGYVIVRKDEFNNLVDRARDGVRANIKRTAR